MMKKRAIADLSKNFRDTERPSIALFKQFCAEQRIDPRDVTVVIRQDQEALGDDIMPIANRVTVRNYGEAPADILRLLNAVGPAGVIHLVSYNKAVLDLEKIHPLVKASSFRALRNGRSFRQAIASAEAIPSQAVAAPEQETKSAVPEQAPEPQPQPQSEPSAPQVVHRSRLMVEILRRRKAGPFSMARPLVYNAIEQVLNERQGLLLGELLDDAVGRAQASAPPDTDGKPQAWPVIRKFVEQLCTRARVFLTADDTCVGGDWRGKATPVAKLAPKWIARADGQLILELLQELSDVSTRDMKNLARALYYNSTAAAEARVREAVLHLLDAGLAQEVEENGESYLGLSSGSAGGTALRVVR